MKSKCAKCLVCTEKLAAVAGGGKSYLLCKACTDLIESSEGNWIERFHGIKEESWVARNIREAKERRARGESLWVNK